VNSSVHCRGAGMRRTFRQHLQNVLVCLFVALVVWPPGVGFCADPAQAAVAPEAKAGFTPQAKPADAKPAATGSGFRVELVKSAPTEGTLRVGGAASFEARLYAGERELPGEAYVCRWLSDAGARFLEAEGPPRNTAVFMRPGRQRVWVEVVPRSGPSQGLAGVSEAVDLFYEGPRPVLERDRRARAQEPRTPCPRCHYKGSRLRPIGPMARAFSLDDRVRCGSRPWPGCGSAVWCRPGEPVRGQELPVAYPEPGRLGTGNPARV